MTEEVRITGAEQFTSLARDLRAAGDVGKGLRLALLKQLRVIAKPIVDDVQRGYFAIPAKGPGAAARAGKQGKHAAEPVGLRVALMRATRTTVSMSGKSASVKVIVDPNKMPDGLQGLPPLMEGDEKWRHPVFGHDVWVGQQAHPVIGPVAEKHQNDASIAANAAITETLLKLERGEP